MAVLRALDKISGRTTDIDAPAGVPVRYGSLIITAQYCYTVPPQEPPETTAFLQIDEAKPRRAGETAVFWVDVCFNARAERARTSHL